MNKIEIAIAFFPSLLTAFVSSIAIISSYKSSRNSSKQAYSNNVDNMRFTQKEKVADQIAEKSAILLTKCDPNVLNTIINEIVPRRISHEENRLMRTRLLGISDEVQTLSNIIKMLTYSIFDDENMLNKLDDIGGNLDAICSKVSDMVLKLCEIYTSMIPEGSIMNLNVMEEIKKLEREFSENYKEPYIQLHLALSDLIWYIRKQSIPANEKKRKHRKKSKNNI